MEEDHPRSQQGSTSNRKHATVSRHDTELQFRLSSCLPEEPVVSVSTRPMRADGVRNRQRVLEAAAELLAERGLKVQVEEIAQRAGVGVGTVCRHFTTKEGLIAAVLERMCEQLLEATRAALSDPDAGRAFTRFVTMMADFQARHRILAERMALTADLPTSTREIKGALRQAVAELVERAQNDGTVRSDIGPADMAML